MRGRVTHAWTVPPEFQQRSQSVPSSQNESRPPLIADAAVIYIDRDTHCVHPPDSKGSPASAIYGTIASTAPSRSGPTITMYQRKWMVVLDPDRSNPLRHQRIALVADPETIRRRTPDQNAETSSAKDYKTPNV